MNRLTYLPQNIGGTLHVRAMPESVLALAPGFPQPNHRARVAFGAGGWMVPRLGGATILHPVSSECRFLKNTLLLAQPLS